MLIGLPPGAAWAHRYVCLIQFIFYILPQIWYLSRYSIAPRGKEIPDLWSRLIFSMARHLDFHEPTTVYSVSWYWHFGKIEDRNSLYLIWFLPSKSNNFSQIYMAKVPAIVIPTSRLYKKVLVAEVMSTFMTHGHEKRYVCLLGTFPRDYLGRYWRPPFLQGSPNPGLNLVSPAW